MTSAPDDRGSPGRAAPLRIYAVLTLADPENVGSASRALAAGCGPTVLESGLLCVLNLSLRSTLYAIRFHISLLMRTYYYYIVITNVKLMQVLYTICCVSMTKYGSLHLV